MTLSARPVLSYAVKNPSTAAIGDGYRPVPGEWKFAAGAGLILCAAYLLTFNGLWRPGADTSYYISIARSLYEGNGFLFNGLPVGKIPPLWPMLLAAAMRISTSFWFLNLIPLALVTATAVTWYWIIRRWMNPRQAFAASILSGFMFYFYTSATELRTEAVFGLLFSVALLLAQQVSEKGGGWFRIIVVAILCALMVAVRWAGMIAWMPVAAAMLSGQINQRKDPRLIGAAIVFIVTITSFVGLREWLTSGYMTKEEYRTFAAEIVAQGGNPADALPDAGVGEDPYDSPPIPVTQAILPGKVLTESVHHTLDAGLWMSSSLFMPLYLGVTSKPLSIPTDIFGWGLIAMFAFCLWTDARARQWVWVGIMLYCGALVVRWRVNPRYLAPIAPLLLVGVWLGMRRMAESVASGKWRTFWQTALIAFLASIGLCNGALWAVDVYISRTDDFYGQYMGGENDAMIAAARYLNDQRIADGEVAVNANYVNLDRTRPNGHGLRSLTLLTNRQTRFVSKKICGGEPNQALLQWAAEKGVKYYLYRPPVSPWRAHHFRVAWLQKMKTGLQSVPENPSWKLYELKYGKAVEINLPPVRDWPDHIPQIGRRAMTTTLPATLKTRNGH